MISQIRIMESRFDEITKTIIGLRETGVDLIKIENSTILPAGVTDDVGIYLIISRISIIFDIAPSTAISMFFITLLTLASLLGIIALFILYREFWTRVYTILVYFMLVGLGLYIGDVYNFFIAMAIAFIPWIVLLVRKKAPYRALLAFGILLGITSGIAHVVRSHSATGVLLFFGATIAFSPFFDKKKRLLVVGSSLLLFFLPMIAINGILEKRNQYITQTTGQSVDAGTRHPFWHSVYIGFGFLNNPLVPAYQDEVAASKVRMIDPSAGYVSPRYESILRVETINLIVGHPIFALTTLFAKLGVVLIYLIVFGNISILLWAGRKLKRLPAGAFWISVGFNSLFGLLIVPEPQYLLGMIAAGSMFSVLACGELFSFSEVGGNFFRAIRYLWLLIRRNPISST